MEKRVVLSQVRLLSRVRLTRISQPARDQVRIQLEPKIFANGDFVVRLDAKVYPFGLGSPLGGPSPIAKALQTWSVGPIWMLRSIFDDLGKGNVRALAARRALARRALVRGKGRRDEDNQARGARGALWRLDHWPRGAV